MQTRYCPRCDTLLLPDADTLCSRIEQLRVENEQLKATVAMLREAAQQSMDNISLVPLVEALTSTAEASERFMNEERAKVLDGQPQYLVTAALSKSGGIFYSYPPFPPDGVLLYARRQQN
jgi:hypothetical protein